MVAIVRAATAVALAAAFIAITVRAATAHPMHTTLAEVRVDMAQHTVRATIRLFADDFAAALPKGGTPGTFEPRAAAYVVSSFSLSSAGRPVVLRSCGIRRSGDLMWVCVESAGPGDIAHLRARNALLVETFPDEVNIVQIGDGPGRRSILFLRGDGDKPLTD
jgi:hypothetical protein